MQEKFRVLITTKLFGIVSDEPIKMLEEAGCEVIKSPLRHPIGPGDFATLVNGVDAAIVGNDTVDKVAIDAADRLKVICMHGVGIDAIDVAAARQKGITVLNLPGGNAEAVAELACGMMFGLTRRINEADRNMRAGHWKRHIGDEIAGKTLGLIGLGSIGKAFAIKGKALGMKVLAFNRSKDADFASRNGIEYTNLDTLLRTSDFVSLHIPMSKEAYHIIDAQALSKMKDGAYIINTSRGGLIDESALYEAIKGGYIAGAALDVFEKEPTAKDSPLLALDNCIFTPHMGAQSKESMLRNNIAAVRKVLDVLIPGYVAR